MSYLHAPTLHLSHLRKPKLLTYSEHPQCSARGVSCSPGRRSRRKCCEVDAPEAARAQMGVESRGKYSRFLRSQSGWCRHPYSLAESSIGTECQLQGAVTAPTVPPHRLLSSPLLHALCQCFLEQAPQQTAGFRICFLGKSPNWDALLQIFTN